MRKGKIGRLPWGVRNKLNLRLRNGEASGGLLEWLNSLPRVQTILAEEFEGRAITEQNLSEWRQGGYLDWERYQEGREWVDELSQQTNDLNSVMSGTEVSHRMAMLVSVEVARAAERMLKESEGATPQERWEKLERLLGILSQLRESDRRMGWLAMERERRDDVRREKQVKRESAAGSWLSALTEMVNKETQRAQGNPGKSKEIQPNPR